MCLKFKVWYLSGGGRIVIDLKDYIVIQEEPMSPENANYIQIGQTKDKGEKVILVYFDLKKAVDEGVIEQFGEPPSEGQEKWDIAVTDSRMNFRLEYRVSNIDTQLNTII